MRIGADLWSALAAHAGQEAPRECCGVVVERLGVPWYWPCRNRSPLPNQFEIHPADWAEAEEAGEIVAVAHSHVRASAAASQADRLGCEASGLPWLIYGWPDGGRSTIHPCGFTLPLVGREFVWGICDCFTLVRDYYRSELGLLIDCPESYEYGFWRQGKPLYARFEAFGFVKVPAGEPPRVHDVFLMRLRSAVENHAAVYLGDGTLLHHLEKRLSERVQYGGFWQDVTVYTVRHASLC
jgi:proteasome lid subunit RPN8/RPN11